MGTQTMGSEGAAAQTKKMQPLSRQGSLYNLTLDEIQTQLGDRGKPLGSMNFDELFTSVWTDENNFHSAPNQVAEVAIEIGCAPASSLIRQGSLTLARDLSKKTVDEVWKHIHNNQERKTSLGEMTLEDFLVKAGVVKESTAPGQKIAGPVLEVNSIVAAQQNVSQHAHWIQYQLPSVQPQHERQQFLPVTANPVLDAQYPENQLTMSPSSLMGTLSDSQTPGRKRVASGDVAEKTVERKHKRMIKNRESAARSRARKQAYTQELENKVSLLEEENERLQRQGVWIIFFSISIMLSLLLPGRGDLTICTASRAQVSSSQNRLFAFLNLLLLNCCCCISLLANHTALVSQAREMLIAEVLAMETVLQS